MTTQFAAIPTMYSGVQMRSRLEAKWAAMFDKVKWEWQYEPFDLNGWIPDFLISNVDVGSLFISKDGIFGPSKLKQLPILVEIKPIFSDTEKDSKANQWFKEKGYKEHHRNAPEDIINKIEKSIGAPSSILLGRPSTPNEWDSFWKNLQFHIILLGGTPEYMWQFHPDMGWISIGEGVANLVHSPFFLHYYCSKVKNSWIKSSNKVQWKR